jgi:ribosome-associated protein
MNPKQKASRDLVLAVCRALLEKKATDLRVLDVSAISSITDYLVVATGTSEPHLRALRIEADQALATARAGNPRLESAQESGWTVIDAFDVMIHLFTEEQRDRYRLEHLWKDADELNVAKLLDPDAPAAKVPAKPSAKAPGKALAKAPGKAVAKPKAKPPAKTKTPAPKRAPAKAKPAAAKPRTAKPKKAS